MIYLKKYSSKINSLPNFSIIQILSPIRFFVSVLIYIFSYTYRLGDPLGPCRYRRCRYTCRVLLINGCIFYFFWPHTFFYKYQQPYRFQPVKSDWMAFHCFLKNVYHVFQHGKIYIIYSNNYNTWNHASYYNFFGCSLY